jgi:hypothetical protein
MTWQRFTEVEAQALVGKRVRSERKWGDIARGTTGIVSSAQPTASGHDWLINITWDAQGHARPLSDWLSAGEYRRWVREPR